MPALIIFLATAITAIIGPWVDAPVYLSTLAGCIAILVACFSMTSLRRRLHEAQHISGTDLKDGDSLPQDHPTLKNEGHSKPEASPSASTMLQSRLQVESMRNQALEGELREIRKRHDELLRERVDLLRRAAVASESGAKSAVPPKLGANHEGLQKILQRDQWIHSQQAYLEEFRTSLTQVQGSMKGCLEMFHALSFNHLDDQSLEGKSGLQLKLLLTSISETLENALNANTPPADSDSLDPPESIDSICAGFATMTHRLEEVADRARIATMNAGLMRDRPVDIDAIESLGHDTVAISTGLGKIVALAAPFAPRLENTRRQLEDNDLALKARTSALQEHHRKFEQRVTSLSIVLRDRMVTLQEILGSDAESSKTRRTDLSRIQAAVDDSSDALSTASRVAQDMDLTLERMVEGSKIAVGNGDGPKMPQESSAVD